mgnify:CR=1 FL=1|tara:strand:- start:2080 stop:2679 length:600 start_codon:yes stop_codon:yes gene_type:complete
MAEKTNEEIVLETLGEDSSSEASSDVFTFLKRLTEEIGSDTLAGANSDVEKQTDSIITTLLELTDNVELQDVPTNLPTISVDDIGKGTLLQVDTPIDLTPVRTETIEKTIVEREITVSSDQVDKQTVNEIDFNKSDFTATRFGDVLTVSIKDNRGSIAYVSSTDPVLTNDVSSGQFWFWTLKGKLYIRYGSYWVQPHPN